MMDDTSSLKPNVSTFNIDKKYLHGLNGRAEVAGQLVNSSQLNVIFPYKKMTSKSMYQTQLKVQSERDIDETLERSRNVTLQGKVSYEQCLRGVARVGGNLYVMSPTVNIEGDVDDQIHGNGLTIVNGIDKPYHFPHSMTLFQPSQEMYRLPNLSAGEDGYTNFVRWYETHDRKTIVQVKDTYGGNTSEMTILGPGSYEMELATYCPTNIVVGDKWTNLDSQTLRQMRSEGTNYKSGHYIFDNGQDGDVGLMFNLYDTFITGNDRVLRIVVPQDKDYNRLFLKFEVELIRDPQLFGDMEAVVMVNEDVEFEDDKATIEPVPITRELTDMSLGDTTITLTVRIHHQVDFGRRNAEDSYRQMLKRSGILLRNIRVENQVSAPLNHLTFGSYVNEVGITESQRSMRYREFWLVQQYKKDMVYQTVLETSLKNMSSAGLTYHNNYSSGDLYGDMFVTKSMLDSSYDMQLSIDKFDFADSKWVGNDSDVGRMMLHAVGRDYLGMDSCSDQLSLFYRPSDIAIGYVEKEDGSGQDNSVYARRVNSDQDLKYQLVEVVKNINRFESSIKHKSNVFSVVVENSNLAKDESEDADPTLEKYKEQLRNSVTQFVRDVCQQIVPVHTQLFDVQFT